MSGLSRRTPFDVRFDFHYNYKSRILIMEGLTKRAPFDVRFALHYNYMYKSRILQ